MPPVDLRIEDHDHSARVLGEGVVMGAVPSERAPVSSYRVLPLGAMRCIAVAAGGMSSVILLAGSQRGRRLWLHRWRGIVTMHCRTCWCARCFDATSPGRCTSSRQRRG